MSLIKRTLFVVAVLQLFSCLPGYAKAPNIVLILADDLGWSDLSCYGSRYCRTPNLDRLATQGMRFTQAYSASGVCSPSRASILTGKHPARLHLTDFIAGEPDRGPKNPLRVPQWTKYLPTTEDILPEALGRAGYVSANVGKWHLGTEEYWPEKQGFNVNIAGKGYGTPPSYFWPYRRKNQSLPVLEAGGAPGEYLTDRLTTEAINFMRESREKPFFLYLSHHAVHVPFQAKPEKITANAARLQGTDANTTYAAMMESLDESVGGVMHALDDLKLASDTMLIFTSDNGGYWPAATDNSPLRAGKCYPYEGGIRVPFIVRYPGVVKAGVECDKMVVGSDLFPTLLEIAGASRDSVSTEPLYGKSIVPLLKQTGNAEHDVLYWHYPHYWHVRAVQPHGVVRAGDWKLIEFFEDMRVELYNIANDLGEKHDLAKVNVAKADELRAMLHKWREDVGAQMPERKAPGEKPAAGNEKATETE